MDSQKNLQTCEYDRIREEFSIGDEQQCCGTCAFGVPDDGYSDVSDYILCRGETRTRENVCLDWAPKEGTVEDQRRERCRDCAYLVEGDNGEWICDDCGKDIHTIPDEECSANEHKCFPEDRGKTDDRGNSEDL